MCVQIQDATHESHLAPKLFSKCMHVLDDKKCHCIYMYMYTYACAYIRCDSRTTSRAKIDEYYQPTNECLAKVYLHLCMYVGIFLCMYVGIL